MTAQLCVALDGSNRDWIVTTAQRLSPTVDWLKIGLEAFTAHGPDLVREVNAHRPSVFLDLKLHDIPTTVARAAAQLRPPGRKLAQCPCGRRAIDDGGSR